MGDRCRGRNSLPTYTVSKIVMQTQNIWSHCTNTACQICSNGRTYENLKFSHWIAYKICRFCISIDRGENDNLLRIPTRSNLLATYQWGRRTWSAVRWVWAKCTKSRVLFVQNAEAANFQHFSSIGAYIFRWFCIYTSRGQDRSCRSAQNDQMLTRQSERKLWPWKQEELSAPKQPGKTRDCMISWQFHRLP